MKSALQWKQQFFLCKWYENVSIQSKRLRNKTISIVFWKYFFAHVLTCQCTLRAYIVTCHNALHGDMLMCEHALYAYVLTCQRALYAYILTCQYALHADMLKCQLLMFFFPVSVPLLLKLYTFDSLISVFPQGGEFIYNPSLMIICRFKRGNIGGILINYWNMFVASVRVVFSRVQNV